MSEEENKQRIEKQSIQLILADRFFGSTLLSLDVQPSKAPIEKSIAITDGLSVKYDPAQLEGLNDMQVRGVLAEPTLHCAFLHPTRLGKYDDQEVAQKAGDHEVHCTMQQYIDQCKSAGKPAPYELPPGADYQARFNTLCAEEIYHILIKEKGPGKKPPGKGKQPPPNNPGGQQPGEGEGDGKSKPRPVDFECPKVSHGEQRKIEEDWKKRLVQAKQMGYLPAGLERLVDNLVNPKVPWQEKLRHLITIQHKDNYDWMKPNKTFLAMGLWLPSLYSQRMGPVVIGQDTSGSMSEASIALGRTESMSILEQARPEKLILSDIDADVHTWHEYEPGEKIRLKCTGGGGSDMVPLFQRIEKEGITPVVCIVITDCAVNFPAHAPSYPVIWLTEEKNATVPFGEIIVME